MREADKAATNLGRVLRRWRTADELSLRDAAQRIGIGHATLMRAEQGYAMDALTFGKIMMWMLQPNPSGEAPRKDRR